MALEQEILSSIQATNRILSQLVLRTGANPFYTSYEAVAASATAQVLGGTGAIGDFLAGVLVIPATTTPGAISVLDGSTSFSVFAGGTVTVQPFFIPLGITSTAGAWKMTTGTSVSAIAVGSFK